MVLIRVDQAKVRSLSRAEPVGAVEQQSDGPEDVLGHVGIIDLEGRFGARGADGLCEIGTVSHVLEIVVEVVGVRVRIADQVGRVGRRRAAICLGVGVGPRVLRVEVVLVDPDEFFNRVRKVEADLLRDRIGLLVEGHVVIVDDVLRGDGRIGRDVAQELHLLDQQLVRLLREPPALLGVQVDVVDVELGREPERRRRRVLAGRLGDAVRGVDDGFIEFPELEKHARLVKLEADEREREAGVAVHEEDQGNVERPRRARRFFPGRIAHVEVVVFPDHLVEARNALLGFRKFVPNINPFRQVLVDAEAADLQFDRLEERVADRICPAHERALALLRRVRIVGAAQFEDKVVPDARRGRVQFGQLDFQVHAGHEVAGPGHGGRYLPPEIRGAVEGLLDGLDRERGVAFIDLFKKRYLWITDKRHVLAAESSQLQDTAAHV